MKNRLKIVMTMTIGLIASQVFGQVRIVNSATNSAAINSSAFIDASSNSTTNPTNNIGKGLLFPRTDLTTFSAFSGSPVGLGSSYPTRFDGMIVYNTGTGSTLASASDSIVSVTPGYYYYDNKTTNLKGGKWTRMDATATDISKLLVQSPAKDSILSVVSSNGKTLTNGNGILINGSSSLAKSVLADASLRLDSTAIAKMMMQSPVKDSAIKTVTTSQTFRDSVTSTVNNSLTSGAITGKDITNDNGIIVTGGTGTSLKATSLRLDSTAIAKMMMQSPVKDSAIKTVTTSQTFRDSVTSTVNNSLTSGAITGKDITNDNGIIVTGGSGTSLKATSLRLDSTAIAKMMMQSPVKDSAIKTVTTSQTFRDSVTSTVNNSLTSGAITGKDITNDNGIIVTGGSGTSLKATSLRLDSTAIAKMMMQSPVKDSAIKTVTTSQTFRDSVTSTVNNSLTSGAITGKDITNDNGIIVTGGSGTSLKATSLRLDSTAIAKMMMQSPVKDSAIKTVTTSQTFRDSVTSTVNNSLTSGAITGKDLTNSNGIIVIGGTGTTLKSTSLRLDSSVVANMVMQSPVKDSIAKVAAGATTNTLTAASNSITNTTNGVAATLTPAAGTIASGKTLGFDITGNLVTGLGASPDSTTADNGLTMTGKNIALGGALTAASTITTTATNTLALAGLQSGAATDSILVVNPTTGVIARRSAASVAASSTTNTSAFNTTTRVLTNTVNGVAATSTIPNGPDSTTADNGLTMTGKNIALGGALTAASTITTTATNTLALAGLQSGAATDSILVVNPTTGVIARRSMPAGMIMKRVKLSSATNQTISDPNTPASPNPIIATYEDSTGAIISLNIVSRIAGTSFTINSATSVGSGYLNYAYPSQGIVIATGPQGPAGPTGASATPTADSTTASNGLTLNGKDVRLGGSLTAATTVTTSATNTLALAGLQSGTTADSLVVVDASTGVLKRISTSMMADKTQTNNGLSKSGDTVQLGGALTAASTITTTATNTLALAGLQSGAATDSILVVNPTTGVIARRSMPAGMIMKRVKLSSATNQTILDPNTPASPNPIIATYEDSTGDVISVNIVNRSAGASFTINSATSVGSGYLNYAYPSQGIVIATGPQGPAGPTGASATPTADSTTASNGLTLNGKDVRLGGSLSTATILTTTATNTLALAGLQSGAATDSILVTNPSTGVLKRVSPSALVSSSIFKGRVACAGTSTQTIADASVTATSTIVVTYEDSGDMIYATIGSRAAGSGFTVQFSSIPSTTGFINYTIIP